jgi:hypothetical protein
MQRDLMSDRIGERLADYQNYEFVSSEAREQFEQLMAELRRDVLNTYFEKSKEMINNPDPEELARMRDMMDALSTMIEQDRRGEELDPTFKTSWTSSATSSPAPSPRGRRAHDGRTGRRGRGDVQLPLGRAAGRAAFDVRQMMENMELNFSLNRLVSNLRHGDARHRLEPRAPPARRRPLVLRRRHLRRRAARSAEGPRGVPRRANAAQGLPEVDVEAVRRNLGADAAAPRRAPAEGLQGLKDQGFVDREGSTTDT